MPDLNLKLNFLGGHCHGGVLKVILEIPPEFNRPELELQEKYGK